MFCPNTNDPLGGLAEDLARERFLHVTRMLTLMTQTFIPISLFFLRANLNYRIPTLQIALYDSRKQPYSAEAQYVCMSCRFTSINM